jgi:ATP-dependent RNA helicase DeaD
MTDPLEVSIGHKNQSNENIDHIYYVVKEKDRYAGVKRLIDFNPEIYGLIFCRTRQETATVAEKLAKEGYSAEPLHGDLSQVQRDRVMDRFRKKDIQILVATDVAARGLDIDNITHVINYNLPDDIENYTHRSGRTGRAGKTGVSYTLLHMREGGRLKDIERMASIKFEKILIPSAEEVRDKKLMAFTDTILNTEIEENIFDEKVMASLETLMQFEKTELLQKFLSLELRRFSVDFTNAPDLNINERSTR